MLIGILSDIHGNDAALAACLDAMSEFRVTKLFILGDFVGYYYNAKQVLEMLDDWDFVAILGNHDRLLLQAMTDPGRLNEITKKYGHGIEVALNTISVTRKKWLQALPCRQEVEIDGIRFLLSHGSPFDPDSYVYPDADRETLDRCAQSDVDYVLMGHTHYPFSTNVGAHVIMNPGSVGQPRDVAASASFIVFNTDNRVAVYHRRSFPIDEIARQICSFDPALDYLDSVLRRGN